MKTESSSVHYQETSHLERMKHGTIAYNENFTKDTLVPNFQTVFDFVPQKYREEGPIPIFKVNKIVYTYFKEGFAKGFLILKSFGMAIPYSTE